LARKQLSGCGLAWTMAASALLRKSAGPSPLLASASARSKPRYCENSAIRRGRAISGSLSKTLCKTSLGAAEPVLELVRLERCRVVKGEKWETSLLAT